MPRRGTSRRSGNEVRHTAWLAVGGSQLARNPLLKIKPRRSSGSANCQLPTANYSSATSLLSSTLCEPAPADQVQEHDHVAAVHHHELEVAAAERLAGPPAVLHHPVPVDGIHPR